MPASVGFGGELKKVSYARGRLDAPSLVRTLKGADAVFFFGSPGDETAFAEAASNASWSPDLYLLGALAGRGSASALPAGFGGRVFIAESDLDAYVQRARQAALGERARRPQDELEDSSSRKP